MSAYPANAERCRELVLWIEASADRICDYQDQLKAGTSSLKPIEYERLLDAYRAELIRYDRLDRELSAFEEPKKTDKYRENKRIYRQQRQSKVKY